MLLPCVQKQLFKYRMTWLLLFSGQFCAMKISIGGRFSKTPAPIVVYFIQCKSEFMKNLKFANVLVFC